MVAPAADDVGSASAAAASATPQRGETPRWAIHRRLYDWTLSFANRPNATPALAVISFAESSFFPIPPDVLLAPLCLGSRSKAMWFALVTTVASVLGAFLGYAIGAGAIGLAYYIPGITEEAVAALEREFEVRGEYWVFIAGLTPIPFKLLTITAGAADMNLFMFTLACLTSRGLRFFGVAGLFWWIGPRATPLIDRYFNHLALIFVILLVGGFVVLSVLHHDDAAPVQEPAAAVSGDAADPGAQTAPAGLGTGSEPQPTGDASGARDGDGG